MRANTHKYGSVELKKLQSLKAFMTDIHSCCRVLKWGISFDILFCLFQLDYICLVHKYWLSGSDQGEGGGISDKKLSANLKWEMNTKSWLFIDQTKGLQG